VRGGVMMMSFFLLLSTTHSLSLSFAHLSTMHLQLLLTLGLLASMASAVSVVLAGRELLALGKKHARMGRAQCARASGRVGMTARGPPPPRPRQGSRRAVPATWGHERGTNVGQTGGGRRVSTLSNPRSPHPPFPRAPSPTRRRPSWPTRAPPWPSSKNRCPRPSTATRPRCVCFLMCNQTRLGSASRPVCPLSLPSPPPLPPPARPVQRRCRPRRQRADGGQAESGARVQVRQRGVAARPSHLLRR
jgi:hypothetical protein